MKKIQILGTGCPKCKQLTANAEQAARELGIEVELEKVTDINEIMKFGVMVTPSIVIDAKVKPSVKLTRPKEIKTWIQA